MRVRGDALAILPTVGKIVARLDPDVPLIQPMLQQTQFEQSISQQVMFARLAEFFGLLAMVLVATGLYGSLAYRVNLRTAEIGVRMAVGARREQVVGMILKDSLLLTVIGLAVGIPLAILVGKALESSLYGVKPLDAMSYLLAVGGLAAVALAASTVPAARAANVDPLSALRTE
jgi:ABC-type antimicrobial peptide transport system permease subunit